MGSAVRVFESQYDAEQSTASGWIIYDAYDTRREAVKVARDLQQRDYVTAIVVGDDTTDLWTVAWKDES